MNKLVTIIAVLLLIGAGYMYIHSRNQHVALCNKFKTIQDEKKSLQDQNASLRAKLENPLEKEVRLQRAQDEKKSLQDQNASLRAKLEKTQEKNGRLQYENRRLITENSRLGTRLLHLSKDLESKWPSTPETIAANLRNNMAIMKARISGILCRLFQAKGYELVPKDAFLQNNQFVVQMQILFSDSSHSARKLLERRLQWINEKEILGLKYFVALRNNKFPEAKLDDLFVVIRERAGQQRARPDGEDAAGQP